MLARISMRPARSSDLDRILEIEHASFGRDAYDRNLFAHYLHKCGDLFLVALRSGKVCGYMITCIGGRQPASRAELVSIAVDPQLRGRGIASALMSSALRRLRRRRIVRFSLMVKVRNRAALNFYEKYGFLRNRIVRHYYEDGADAWQMVRVEN